MLLEGFEVELFASKRNTAYVYMYTPFCDPVLQAQNQQN